MSGAVEATVLAGYLPGRLRSLIRKGLADRSDEEFDLQVNEFLKFMYISSTYGGSFIPLSKEVDEVWHECIMQTKFHEDMCNNLPGQRFIHHQSMSLEEHTAIHGRKYVVKQMLSWLPNYHHHFGEFTEAAAPYRTIVRFLRVEMGLSLDEVNDLARTEAGRRFALAS